MAVIGNKATAIGDVLEFSSSIPIFGILGITSFEDDVTGVIEGRAFQKEFQFIKDGQGISVWQLLTNENLAAIQFDKRSAYFFNYKYTRVGNDTTGELAFNSVKLIGTYEQYSCGITFENSYFSEFIDCSSGIDWCLNVTDKLYKDGIVPAFITRGKNLEDKNDEDYFKFWKTVACFFSIFVAYARYFQEFYYDEKLLKEFLKQRNIFFCSDSDLDTLQLLMLNYIKEISKRGTYRIVDLNSLPKGELLRLICHNTGDEFIFNQFADSDIGFCLGHSSPMYKGSLGKKGITKAYEKTVDFVDLLKYPTLNNNYLSLVQDGADTVLKIHNVPNGQKAGIGVDIMAEFDFSKAIVVDSDVGYIISFCVKDVGTKQNNLSFGINAFDVDDQHILLEDYESTKNIDFFFIDEGVPIEDEYYFVKGILFRKGTQPPSGATTLTIGYGNHLKFPQSVKEIKKIIPFLYVTGTALGNTKYIKDFKVRPLKSPTSFGFLNVKDFIQIWLKNNSSVEEQDLEDIIRNYLVGYKNVVKTVYYEQVEL